ncbi:hypothetical protein [Agromyces ramosus]|uniref:Uncharacterized protein n=1 Tax=Agromyces ramosus TaxID=33879 RepID=A0ABU0R9Y3_9MICO|nr:hypothetical protein [Agromyces ramosus]MDQ0894863.1 hypothetical protein [Agromyces ramosus]
MRFGRPLPAASIVVLLAGCSPYWAASGDTFVEYSGSDRGKVQACADFSANSEHQASAGIPLYVVVTDIDVAQMDGAWDITGTTLLVNDHDEYLAWSCRVTIDAESRSMHAQLMTTRPGQELPLCGNACSAPTHGSIEIEFGDSLHSPSSLPCIDLAAAVASPPDHARPIRATVRGDHDAPTRRFHGTLEVGSRAAYQWTCELSKADDPWALDYELTAFEPS